MQMPTPLSPLRRWTIEARSALDVILDETQEATPDTTLLLALETTPEAVLTRLNLMLLPISWPPR